MALLAATLSAIATLAPAMRAEAASNQGSVALSGANTFFAYLRAGETIAVSITPTATTSPTPTVSVVSPTGATLGGNGTYTATTAGVYRITTSSNGSAAQTDDWSIVVRSGTTVQTGRVWTDRYSIYQPPGGAEDIKLWMVNNAGYVYAVTEHAYYGVNSVITADSVGNAVSTANCATSAYASTENLGIRPCGARRMCCLHRWMRRT
jgi:hypothetical protein